jgi:hypothetical protein
VAEKAVGKNASPSPDTTHSPSPQKSVGTAYFLIKVSVFGGVYGFIVAKSDTKQTILPTHSSFFTSACNDKV